MKKQIVIADDNKINRQMLVRALRDEYDILEAANGDEALALVWEHYQTLSAVMLDIIMPGMDGYDVLRRIRADARLISLPVIMVTAANDEETRVKCLSLSANDFVGKPFNQDIIKHCLRNNITLYETAATVHALQRDRLTGLYNREVFFEKVRELVSRQEPGYYTITCFDINKFKVINDQYGTEKGDEVLRHLGSVFESGFAAIGGVCCRIAADDFAILYPTPTEDDGQIEQIRARASRIEGLLSPIVFSTGRYVINDLTLTPSAMYDRAMLAAESVKGKYDDKIAYYTEAMRDHLMQEQEIVMEMENALLEHQFEAWFQPQYNHATGALIGAEALARWRHPKRGFIPPGVFIPIFEKNGFVYSLDRYIWEQVCIYLRKKLDEGSTPLPISVNISRYDVFRTDFLEVITGLVKKYQLPIELLRLEITESAFASSTVEIVNISKQLIDYGFTLEIDDFGSGYSSLNTLKNVPAHIVKLDMRFFENNQDAQRGGNIIESVVRMAKWLGMSVIAEGVEEKSQADFLKSIGSYYIQGYYYARPMPENDYEQLQRAATQEAELHKLETVENLNNNAFWDHKSMETLIFNSYIGGACIFEYHDGITEVIRNNDEYAQVFSGHFAYDFTTAGSDPLQHLDEAGKQEVMKNIHRAIRTKKASTCEALLSDGEGHYMYLRTTVRVIAQTEERYLFYCVVHDITEQRVAEIKERQTAEQLAAIMGNINGGVTAVTMQNGNARLLFANDQFYRQLGYTKEQFDTELTGIFDSICPEDRARVMAEAEALSKTESQISTSYRVMRRDGSIRWMQGSITNTTLPGETVPVQLAVTTDITKELEHHQMMDELLNAIPGGVVVYRVGETIETLYSTDGMAKLTGISNDEYERWQQGDILNLALFKDDAPMVKKQLMSAVAQNKPVNMTFRLNHVNGSPVWVTLSASMIREESDGKIYYGVFTKPPTETALYQSLVEDSPTAAIILEKQNRKILYANPMWRALEGIPKDVMITGIPLFEVLPYQRKYFSDEELKALPSDRYFETHRTSGAEKNVLIYARSLVWNGVDAYVCYISDETELLSNREQLQHLIDRVPVGIGICEIRGEALCLRYINDSYYEMLGFTHDKRNAHLGMDVINAIYREDRPVVADAMRCILMGKNAMDISYRTRNSKNQLLWVRLQASVIERTEEAITVYCALTECNSAITGGEEIQQIAETLFRIDYESILTINAQTGEAQPIRSGHIADVIGEQKRAKDNVAGVEAYLRQYCTDADVEKVVRETSLPFVKERLNTVPVHTVLYTLQQNGKVIRKRAVYTYLNGEKNTILCAMQTLAGA